VKKSELKKRLIEALTPDEAAKVEPKYKETYAAMIKGKGPLKLKKYDNPDKVVRGRVVNTIKNESLKIAEKLGKKAKVGDYIEDFTDSDAPQFKGKSDKKKKQMAVAAFLNKEEQKLDEIDAMMEESAYEAGRLEKKVKAILKKEGGAVGLKPLVDAAKELGATKKDLMGILKKMKEVKTHKDGDIIDTDGLNETGQEKSEKNYSNYFKKMDKNRLNELVKAALMSPINEKKKDHDGDGDIDSEDYMIARDKAIKKSKGKVDEYDSAPPNNNVFFRGPTKAGDKIEKEEEEETNESFDSLSKKIDKQKGKSKKDAANIAGYIANIKRKGGGKGPTAKQKKRMAETILKELRG